MILHDFIEIDREAELPLAEQIYRQMRDAGRSGLLPAGVALPSSRMLADKLGVSRNTVTAAYDLLRAEGLLTSRPGAVPRLSVPQAFALVAPSFPDRPVKKATPLSQAGTQMTRDRHAVVYNTRTGRLRPGHPDITLFPRDAWARVLRRAARTLSGDALLYEHAEGLPALRSALARTLHQTRGLQVSSESILVLPTVQSGLGLLSRCLTDPGDTVWMEDPGYLGARQAFATAHIDPMPVDDEDANVASMQSTPRLIYVTPSHQYPTGVRMSLGRRLALLSKAREQNAIVVEDDYDSEFLWSGRAIPALGALASQGEVVTLGTVAKSMLPGLRLAWMVVPPLLSDALRYGLLNLGLMVNVHVQAAFVDFIESGQYGRHLDRISGIYRARGDILISALRRHCGNHIAVPILTGGLHMTLHFQIDVDDQAIAEALGNAGFRVPALSRFYLGASQRGLVVAFADVTTEDAERFAKRLAHYLNGPSARSMC